MLKRKKLMALSIGVMLTASVLAGCKNSTASKEDPTKEPVKQNTTEKADWELNTEPFTITWYRNGSYSNSAIPQDNYMYKILKEKTNLEKIEWIVPASDPDQKLNAMIASDTLPDVLTIDSWSQTWVNLQKNGLLASYTELSREYAPNLMNVLPKTMTDWYKDETGNLYVIPNYFFAEENQKEGNYLETNLGFTARKDIMDALGIKPEDFNTQDGAIEALKKVKGYKYKGQEVVPFTLSQLGGYGESLNALFPQLFGIPFESQDGNYQDLKFMPEYKEVVSFVNRLYREGLISAENFTWNTQTLKDKYQNGTIFMTGSNIADYQSTSKELVKSDPNAVTINVGPIMSSSGRKPYAGATVGNGWTLTMINAKSKYKAEIVRAIEWMNTDEGKMAMNYGKEGETYTLSNDGRVQWIGDYKKDVDSGMSGQDRTNKWGLSSIWWFDDGQLQQRTQPESERPEDIMWKSLMMSAGKSAILTRATSGLSAPGGSDEAAISQQIDSAWQEAVPKMIMASTESGALAEYDAFIKKTKDMGYDNLYKVLNEQFQANKKKLGVDRAFPY